MKSLLLLHALDRSFPRRGELENPLTWLSRFYGPRHPGTSCAQRGRCQTGCSASFLFSLPEKDEQEGSVIPSLPSHE